MTAPDTPSREVERHPGPFAGPDAELARACAMAVILWYGNDDEVAHQRIMKDGIWNDHVAVQAALAAIHHLRSLAAKLADDGVREALPEDIRALGWTVAVHNDYRQLDEPHTFWLFTKDGLAVKGEGMSDAEALNKVRKAIRALSTKAKP